MRVIEPNPRVRADLVHAPFFRETFELRPRTAGAIRVEPWSFGFGEWSEVVFRDHYARGEESWSDCVIRVVEGTLSIRKSWYLSHGLRWDDGYWQEIGEEMALAFLKLECGPPGRGYARMGTDYVRMRGSMALINCAATEVTPTTIHRDLEWALDVLGSGSGVGFGIRPEVIPFRPPEGEPCLYVVPDTREGWAESVRLLVESYLGVHGKVAFGYDEIRAKGTPMKSLGATATGPEPLRLLHARMRGTLDRASRREISWTRCVADLCNQIGVSIQSGPRQSAEILCGSPDDEEFLDLKDLEKNPDREAWYWASNNSPRLERREHFPLIATKIAPRASLNGEPGFLNMIATRKFARFGRERYDKATLFNPCAEIPLENKEVCNVSEVYPSRCQSVSRLLRAAELSCLYSSTVALLPTHLPETNAVIARNRRIGVSMSGIADWQARQPDVTRDLRMAYDATRAMNEALAIQAGVPSSVRVTTVKPGGTVPQLAGVSGGCGPAQGRFYIRRKRVLKSSPIVPKLDAARIPREECLTAPDSWVYEFPVAQPGTRTAREAGMHEQALQVAMMQREWSDNAVSCTVEFAREEAPKLPILMSQVAPMVKSMAVLPRDHGYAQAPYEEVSEAEFNVRKMAIWPIDWSGHQGEARAKPDDFCSGPVCKREDK